MLDLSLKENEGTSTKFVMFCRAFLKNKFARSRVNAFLFEILQCVLHYNVCCRRQMLDVCGDHASHCLEVFSVTKGTGRAVFFITKCE